MIQFPPLRTKRLNVNLKELSIGAAIKLCQLPSDMIEVGTSEFLRSVVTEPERERPGQVNDHLLWTVQERSAVVAHYLSATSESPDFEIGDGKYTDYLMMDRDSCDPLPLGDLEGDNWILYPLLGAHAESIERLIRSGDLEDGRTGWWFGGMAAQLWRDNESPVDPLDEYELDQSIKSRAAILSDFPERSAISLLSMYLQGIEKQSHIFRMTFTDEGIAFAVNPESEAADLPPARFPFSATLSEFTQTVFGKAE